LRDVALRLIPGVTVDPPTVRFTGIAIVPALVFAVTVPE
jgi:hypothetical protein